MAGTTQVQGGDATGAPATPPAAAPQETPKAEARPKSAVERVTERLAALDKPKGSPKEDRPAEKQETVPFAALHAEKEKRKELQKKLAELEAQLKPKPKEADDEDGEETHAPKKPAAPAKVEEEADELLKQFPDDPVVKRLRQAELTNKELREMVQEVKTHISEREEAELQAQKVKEQADIDNALKSLQAEHPYMKTIFEKDEDGQDSEALKGFWKYADKHRLYDNDSLTRGFVAYFKDDIMKERDKAAEARGFEAGKNSVRSSSAVGPSGTYTGSKSPFSSSNDAVKRVMQKIAAQGG